MMIQFWMAVALLCALASAFIVVPLARAKSRAGKVVDNENFEGQDRATLNMSSNRHCWLTLTPMLQ